MVRQSFMLVMAVLLLAAVSRAAPQTPLLLPTPVPSCQRWCNHEVDGYRYCCEEEQGAEATRGTCPQTQIQPHELEILEKEGGASLHCETDRDCKNQEKCCYTKFRQQRICRRV
ncbi:uncharacterized protein LOC122244502 isoform X2 [Penaeus japonicus]|nr:uncharacterized protein LOC122244502 isoform X2 [Penaeus japonicus]UGN74324.1 crustin I-4 [Penaeus japonicus]